MGSRLTGDYGQFWAPSAAGVLTSNALLTKSASKTIGGTAYANRFWGTAAATYWNKAQGESLTNEVRIQGVVGGPTISPAASLTNNAIDVPSFSYYQDNGTIATSVAITDLLCVRPAAGKYNWNLVIVTMATGIITTVQGTDGGSYSDTFGAAGGPPLVATTALIVGAVKLYSDVAAVIAGSSITYTLSTGALIQERSDYPGFTVLPMEGGILLNEALPACHTGPVPRNVYASYYDQRPLMIPIGDTEEWTLAMSNTVTEQKAQNDLAAQSRVGTPSYSGSLKRFYVKDLALFANACQRKSGFLRLFPNKDNTSQYYELAAVFSSFNLGCGVGANMEETVNFTVDGLPEARGIS